VETEFSFLLSRVFIKILLRINQNITKNYEDNTNNYQDFTKI